MFTSPNDGSRFRRVSRLLPLLAAAALLAACDNPVEGDDDHERDVVGVVINDMAGGQVATLQAGSWTFSGGASALRLRVGEDLGVRVYFVAADGDRFQLPPAEAEYTLRVAVAEPGIARYAADAVDHGHFVGVAAGSTSARIQLFHGSHADWESSPALPIQVAAQ